jgi:hypothetical protein
MDHALSFRVQRNAVGELILPGSVNDEIKAVILIIVPRFNILRIQDFG